MRSIYKTLQKLKDQEKRERYLKYAESEKERRDRESDLRLSKKKLHEARLDQADSMGMRVVQEYLNMQRHLDIKSAEKELVSCTRKTEKLRQEMIEAQIEAKVMENVVDSMLEEDRKEQKQKADKFNDEIAIMGWRRKI